MQFIDLQTQYHSLKSPIQNRINKVLEHGKFIMGPEVVELEQELSGFVGSRYCLGVSSGSDALLIAMMALGIGPGDEVITTSFSFISSAEMILLLGATPVFIDIESDTYNIDPELIENAITPKTRLILAVSLYGQCASFTSINKIADKHGLAVIEDAAQSFGATQFDKKSCNLTTIGCTSFFPSKPLGCYGDGGACFTNDRDLFDKMRHIRVHGQTERYHHEFQGINGRLDTIQAAILLEKLKVFPEEINQRQIIADRYTNDLHQCLQTSTLMQGNRSVYAQYTIRVENRAEVQEHLRSLGIPTAVHYPVPLPMQPVFQDMGYKSGSMSNAELAADQVLSLPMHPYMTSTDQEKVIDSINDYFNQNNTV